MEEKKLGFGFMRLPLLNENDQTSIDYPQLIRMTDSFMAQGFTYFDTAYMYHDFISEKVVNEVVVKRYPRDSFTIASKMPTMLLNAAEDQVRIFAEQLQKTGAAYFDYYLLHDLNVVNYAVAKKYDTIAFLQQKKAEGYIRRLGFSFHDSAAVLEQILSEHPEFDFVQLQINYLDWDSEGIQSRKCYETARKYGKDIIVMEPVKGGTLAHLPEEAAALLQREHPDWSAASWAIRFAAGLPGVAMVLSGMSSMEQLLDNTGVMRDFIPLTQSEQDTLFLARDSINSSIAIPCTNCRYCVEGGSCPQNIAIPNYFSLYNTEQQDKNTLWSPQREYYMNLAGQGYGKASSCIECRQCEDACPQHIHIIDWLKQVAGTFETEDTP